MFDTKDFSLLESQSSFDFKGFLIKTTGYWKWFLAAWIIAFTVAYQINVRKEKIYSISNSISIKEENNPFFTSNTSLVFNWGGTSDQVQTITTMIKSRSHNETVVDRLELYVNYLKKGEYNIVDAYGQTPFYVTIDKKMGQLSGSLIGVKFISANEYEININFESENVGLIRYADNSTSSTAVQTGIFTRRYKVGEPVSLPFLSWTLEIHDDNPGNYANQEYFVSFGSFDGTVSRYRNINVEPIATGSSILTLSLQGTNKHKLVTYLNTTVEVLRDTQLKAKNQFATNTIAFIDSTMLQMEKQLEKTGEELKDFRKDKNIYQIEAGGDGFTERILNMEVQKDQINRKMAYYNSLKSYLNNSIDFSKLPAPSVAGIDDPNIVQNVGKLIALSTKRSEMKYAVKNDRLFQEFDQDMIALKNVLLENIETAKASLVYDLKMVSGNIYEAESAIRKLPGEQQELINIKRKYNLTDNIYSAFLAKRTEADMLKAANVSDIRFIDNAKDIGGSQVGPKTGVNYVLAFFTGLLLPLLVIFIIFLLDNSIQNPDDISKLTKLPLIGVVGKKQNVNNLSVYEKPKSALAESFRAIRSSLQFLYKKQKTDGAKTLMITSSVSGEGKTFCSINIATVFALSEKKTIIIGMDLRKPKIFNDFNIANDIGVVNYLIGQRTLEEVIQPTHVPYLDVITSGPVPPNPSELIMGDALKEMLDLLKQQYDYIILDTPPVGLVSDALELTSYVDLVLYIVRQNYTKKDMITLLNSRQKRGELTNVSIILNGFENKVKYGYGYEYGYSYGYGNYAAGYHEEEKPKNKLLHYYEKFKNNKNSK